MKKYVASGVGLAAAVMFFGAGPAHANDEYKGQTYADAQQAIASGGGTAVIASREGSYLPTEKCVVVGSRRGSFLDSSGTLSGSTVLLDLNCNDTYAGSSGHPGNSAASPEGAKQKKLIDQAVAISQDYADATAKGEKPSCEQYFDSCVQICQETGKCSAELSQYLGL